ncbi:MAG: Ig-like domain-containing protein, partial [Halanaerobiales bacterium]
YTTAMFDDDIFADIINEATDIAKDFPYAEYSLQISDIGMPLYGNALGPDRYWAYFHGGYGSLTAADPHRYIDGQQKPGTSYQVCCSTGFWKHMVIIFTLFPEMKDVWYYQPMETYVQRWVLHGVWTLPDPCAPYDGNLENYEKTYGPDTDNPGDCIKGTIGCIGRYPELHGTNADGAACSGYASALWDDYYVPRADTPPFAAIISPIEDRTVSGDVLLKATAYSVHGLESVEFLVDGETISPVVTAPLSDSPTTYSVPWNTTQLPDGIYSLTVEATGRDGRRYESVAVEVQVDNQ